MNYICFTQRQRSKSRFKSRHSAISVSQYGNALQFVTFCGMLVGLRKCEHVGLTLVLQRRPKNMSKIS